MLRNNIILGLIIFLAICYKAIDQNKNIEETVKRVLLSAEQDDADTQSKLGCYYYQWEGIEKDFHEVVRWFNLAA